MVAMELFILYSGNIFAWLCMCTLSLLVELDIEQLDGSAAHQPSQRWLSSLEAVRIFHNCPQ